jgi:tetratricopeptide (TPR) repeat protein
MGARGGMPLSAVSTRSLLAGALLLAALALPAVARAQGGRYQGSSEAREAFSTGQAASARGDAYLEEGERERARRAYEDAEEAYREALDVDPDFEEAWERLGYVLYVTGRSEDAIELLEDALERVPDSLLLERMLGVNEVEAGRVEAGISRLLAVDAAGAASADVLFVLGAHHYESEDYNEAIGYFQRYLAENPDDAATHGSLGNAYLRTEQYELALAAFRTVLGLEPDNVQARVNMGDVYFASEDHERAVEIYEVVLPSVPDNFRVWFNLGRSRLSLQRPDGALEAFERVVELRPDLYQGHYFRGVALSDLERWAPAAEALERALALNDEHALSHYRLGVARAALGELAEAEGSLTRAVALDPAEPWFGAALGDVERRRGRVSEALARHRALVEAHPEEPAFAESLGRDLYAAGEREAAIERLAEVVERAPDRGGAQQALSVALLARLAAWNDAASDLPAAYEPEPDLRRLRDLGRHSDEVALAEAVVALRGGDGRAAEDALSAVSEETRRSLPYRRVAAQVDLALDRPEAALERLAPDPDQDATLDAVDAHTAGLGAAGAGDWARALRLFEQAAAADPAHPLEVERAHAALRVGMAAAAARDWEAARAAFREAEARRGALAPEDAARASYALGFSELRTGDYGAATRHLAAARDDLAAIPEAQRTRLPDDADLALDALVAFAAYRSGDYRRVVELVGDAAGARRSQAERELAAAAYQRLAADAYERGDLRGARASLEQAVALLPDNAILENNLACLRYGEGERQRAGEVFEALARDDRLDIAYFNHGVYLDEELGDDEGAYYAYRTYLARGGPAADLARTLAEAKADVFGFDGGAP